MPGASSPKRSRPAKISGTSTMCESHEMVRPLYAMRGSFRRPRLESLGYVLTLETGNDDWLYFCAVDHALQCFVDAFERKLARQHALEVDVGTSREEGQRLVVMTRRACPEADVR